MGGGPPTFPWVGVRLGSKKLSLGAVQTPLQWGVGVSLKGVQGSPGVKNSFWLKLARGGFVLAPNFFVSANFDVPD